MTDLLFLDQSPMTGDERFTVTEEGSDDAITTTLHITKVRPYDVLIYQCGSYSTDVWENHTIEVLESPSVQIVPDSVDYIVSIGDNVSLQCTGTGVPPPRIYWQRKELKLPDGRDMHVGSTLSLANASLAHVGTYQCFAENGIDPPAVASINVILKYSPIVKTVNSFVPVSVGQTVAINCTYSANPHPQVAWSFNGYNIDFNQEKIKNRMKVVTSIEPASKENVTILQIHKVILDDFGNYTCQAYNRLGFGEQVILLSGKPGKPYGLTIRPDIRRPGGIDLTWTLISVEKLTGYRIFIKSDDGEHSEVVQVPFEEATSVSMGDSLWKCNCKLNSLQPHKKYTIEVQARNDYGWGLTSSPAYLRMDATSHQKPVERLSDSPGHSSALHLKQPMLAFIAICASANFVALVW
ncbi:immunoglobulin domain protein [Trichuris suis]|nr:immunoglobulin domain protein [Trichuris suis]